MITYHKALSYGGCLQAYATYRLLENLGVQVEVIDFENKFEARKKTRSGLLKNGSLKEVAAGIVKDFLFKGSLYREKAFRRFPESLRLTEKRYSSVGEMGDLSADVFLVGSDQVWNPDITNGYEPAFFLQFGHAAKRISFSSSMGSHSPSPEEKEALRRYLSSFSKISVREKFAANIIEEVTDRKVEVTLDPSLMLSSEEWRRFSKPPVRFKGGPYILLFMVANSEQRYAGFLDKLSSRLGCRVVQVRLNSHLPKGVSEAIPATPQEFVWLLDHASVVFTDSFHGIAFSINMETPFFYLPNLGNNVRLQELLERCGLQDRRIDNVDDVDDISRIDFSLAREFISAKRPHDIEWLSKAIYE